MTNRFEESISEYSPWRAVLVFLTLAAIGVGSGGWLIDSVTREGRVPHLYWVAITLGVFAVAAAIPPMWFATAILYRLWQCRLTTRST